MVKKNSLLLIACLVWFIAGANILNIGLSLYKDYFSLINVLLSCLVFLVFHLFIFSRLVKKHTKRILAYENKKLFINFFDKQSFIIMAAMMSLGILLRNLSFVPRVFIAVFYSGLGTSLTLAGILFGINYLKQLGGLSMKKLINTSFIYLFLGLAYGVFYREFTKFNGFSEKTVLGVGHTHLIVLGFLLFLVLALFSLHTDLVENSNFKKFFKVYNIALPFMLVMFTVRGVLQVLGTELSSAANASISGVAGIAHVLMLVSFILLFLSFKKINLNK